MTHPQSGAPNLARILALALALITGDANLYRAVHAGLQLDTVEGALSS